jgi:hypothetical protein
MKHSRPDVSRKGVGEKVGNVSAVRGGRGSGGAGGGSRGGVKEASKVVADEFLSRHILKSTLYSGFM